MPDPITANQLRWAAERADGTRNTEFALVPDDEEGITVVPLSDARASNAIVRVFTPTSGEGGLQGDAVVEVSYQGHPIDTTGADALFLTQSAVEKFVLPYYTRFRSPAQIQALKNKLFAEDVVIGVHIPPSDTTGRKSGVKTYAFKKTGEVQVQEEYLTDELSASGLMPPPASTGGDQILKTPIIPQPTPPGMSPNQPS